MVALRTNRAIGTLNAGISAGDLSLTLSGGQGALFPSPVSPDYFWATIEQGSLYAPTLREIIKCTLRSTDVLTIQRAQQGSSAQAFLAGDRVELRTTADDLLTLRTNLIETTPRARFTPMTAFFGARVSVDDPWGLFGTALGGDFGENTTSQLTGEGRGAYSSTSAAVGVRGFANDVVFRGNVAGVGGFTFEGKMGIGVNFNSTRLFQGLTDLNSALLINTLNPSAAVSNGLFGFGWDDTSLTSDNLRFFHNAGTGGPVTNLDTGITRANMLTNIIYFWIHAEPASSSISVILKDLVVGTTFNQTISSNIPSQTMGLLWQISTKGNGASNTGRIMSVSAEGRPFAW